MYILIRSFEQIFKKNNIPILKIRKLKIGEDKSIAWQNLELKPDIFISKVYVLTNAPSLHEHERANAIPGT